jgi:phage-related protein
VNLLDLFVKIGVDDSGLDKGLNEAESKSEGVLGKLASGVGKVGKFMVKAGIAATTAVATGIAAITKASVESFGEYQQLVGGVETLFGDSAQQVINDASEAFKTAGMSANEYMETSIQGAAALINSLGGDQAKAAELMNMSITDMADNVNKMCTDMEAVQNAYRGFSRANYTMLDNLALGFAGTKEGMQELLDKAQEISGIEYDISSYADIVEAIHVVQTEMGITGTTSKEAADTIQGSFSSVKAAWDNLVTGIADPDADIGQLVSDVVETAGVAAGNLIPVVEQALTTAGTVVETLVPEIVNRIPGFIKNTLPTLLSAAVNTVKSIAQAFVDNAPMLLQTGIDLLLDLVDGLVEGLPTAIPMIVDCVMQLTEILLDNSDKLIDAGIDLLIALVDGFINAEPQFLEKMPELLEKLARALISGAVKLGEAMIKIAGVMIKNFVSKIPEYAKAAGRIVDVIANTLLGAVGGLIKIGVHLVEGIWKGISSSLGWIKSRITEWVGNVVDFFKKTFKIGSPSKVMSDEVGKWLGLGVYEGWEKNNPIDMINTDIDGLTNGIAVSVNSNNGNSAVKTSIIDYDRLADATVTAFTRAGIGIEIDKREFGRITRGVIAYG